MASFGNDKADEEAEPLYSSRRDESECHCQRKRPRRYLCLGASLLYLLLAVLYILLWIQFYKLNSAVATDIIPDLFPSLARASVIRKDSRVFPLTVAGTPFAGDPSAELDHAWHDLLKDTTIRVSKDDLAYYNVTSLPLADGSGFASELFMTHELHCLKKVRQWIYKETYFTHVQGLELNELKRHVDHCIETLRQGIMCRGDVSLGTYTYLRGSIDVTARSWGKHQCVDFEALITWARERAVDVAQPGVLAQAESLGDEHFTDRKPPH
ncbi:hypothetical protein F5B22DRAFT_655871 [Xylaria bambusicola]|uniref:uncharacterized protein n=1 Tax=Xylaria bambusicola TaxID=326684 RepID=UPI002007AA67|nr:uncharacterized protein F5B22DRAFT_655871 [Xylaria bambusicola]KAI0516712.1 hypothetical protein F5B22DRAFT_655871 [Xylaria bambusicola]